MSKMIIQIENIALKNFNKF